MYISINFQSRLLDSLCGSTETSDPFPSELSFATEQTNVRMRSNQRHYITYSVRYQEENQGSPGAFIVNFRINDTCL